ncbi:uroporphyrinogen-III C-methyltransferase [Halococcoides cellulosivorans]|uniref:uroporphyrinogen-III C-methyltransferase n=1 Tax=Halococcoides cellulosivorans TaxID=1679096 RepID=A0A2R4WYL5_9EURY|nr:uroporphyrinogen-III C-methyltransferase [Halococcoides cellulosivorans]AWB26616.1 uroporphyrinogen-III C-methyltransferase [Halococcoides cellulosivorans]
MTADRSGVGTVHLVGSGPGDPELLTLKARRLIDSADVVMHDALPGPEIIATIPEEAAEDVGKRANGERTPQSEIDDRIVAHAEAGREVVRLKGGDPTVFGRAGAELSTCIAAKIPVEVVPGVTSAIAGPALAGIPVTHRDHASSVTVVTGHEAPDADAPPIDWEALAQSGGTIVVLMGVGSLDEYTAALADGGLDPSTPVALIERASWPDQRAVTGTLETIVGVRDREGVEPPAVTVIGDVVEAIES